MEIRQFCNADLPSLAQVWSEHWAAAGPPPPVSATIIERSILARPFFRPHELLVVETEGRVEAWCHFGRLRKDEDLDATPDQSVAVVSSICFSQAGLHHSDELLAAAEKQVSQEGCSRVVVGLLRDQKSGYVGLPPVGHGIGIPDMDVRVSSLLSRHGYRPAESAIRMEVTTAPYRPPVNREMMQFRRTTRTEHSSVIPREGRYAAAMSHLDIEHHRLINHRSGERLANVRLWLSDPESQVMSCSEAILDLSVIETQGSLTSAESFLVTAVIQSMTTRCVFRLETSIDATNHELVQQLEALQFHESGRGHRWAKEV
ncbi:MAG: hypothetical protein AAF802_13630 [Planctomycetota bacterium]